MSTREWFTGTRLAQLGLALAVLALLALLLSGLGSRWGWWHFRTGFSMLRWAAYGGVAAMLLSVLAAVLTRPGTPAGRDLLRSGFLFALFAALLGAIVFYVPWNWQRVARAAPPIHDITTDVQNPPEFIAVVPLRADAPNPPEYPGVETAVVQRRAYPEIRPLLMELPADAAFERALQVVRELGWQLVVAEPGAGRIEATDRTRWFGFYDDVVVRVTPVDAGRAVVDVRSKSRVGRGDAGENARRIERFLERMRR
jgi:uncharacterized protein (DUF1499 family)